MDAAHADASSSRSWPAPRNGDRHERLRVLLVDDERESRAVLTAMLSVINASVVSVAGAGEALEVLHRQRFDVLISDIGLAGRSGYELVRAIREPGGPLSSLPAIAVTGHDTPEDRARAHDAGFDVHIAKPVDMQVLFSAIRDLQAASTGLALPTAAHVPQLPPCGNVDPTR